MMTLRATAALASSIFLTAAASPASQKTVTITGSVQPDDARADHFTVTVQLDMKEGWHTYGEVGEGPEVRTSLACKLPTGATYVGDWNRPRGTVGSEAGSEVYEGQAAFTRDLRLAPAAYGKKLNVTVSYQACTSEYCNPPQKKTIVLSLPEAGAFSHEIFDAPVRISVGDKFLNAVARKRFPSPAIFDVDSDGRAELVVGSLMGSVGIYENLNTSGVGDPTWSPRKALIGATGEPIRTSNW